MTELPHTTPASEINARIAGLQKRLQASGIDAALVIQKADLFYLAGTIQQAHLWVPAGGEPLLMVRKSLARARAESPMARIVALDTPRQIPELLSSHGLSIPKRLGMELDVVPVNLYRNYERLFSSADIRDVSPDIRLVRAVKSDYELDIIRHAARCADQVAAAVPALIEEGVPEIELAGRVEAHARRLGHQGLLRMRMWGNELFYGHLMAGPSAAEPSYLQSPTGGSGSNPSVAQGAGSRRIRRTEPILVDYVFACGGYMADHARIFALGPLDPDLVKAHEAMCRIHDDICSAVRPGVRAGDLYDMAVAAADTLGYGPHFMGADSHRIRFVGHGIGLELDEFPFLAKNQDMPMAAGMVFALEPKVVFPGRGVVGVENTLVVTDTGCEQLTTYPSEITFV